MPSKTGLGRRLEVSRKNKGLTQQELADLVGSNQDQIQKIENGHSKRPRNLEAIAKALDVSPAWLLYDNDAMDGLSDNAIKVAQAFDAMSAEAQQGIEALFSINK